MYDGYNGFNTELPGSSDFDTSSDRIDWLCNFIVCITRKFRDPVNRTHTLYWLSAYDEQALKRNDRQMLWNIEYIFKAYDQEESDALLYFDVFD